MTAPIRALIVESSANRSALAGALEADRDIRVVASSRSVGLLEAATRHRPDIVVLHARSESLALTAIEQLMARAPIPILVVAEGAFSRDRMLKAGALEVLDAPGAADAAAQAQLRRRVRAIRKVQVIRHVRGRASARTSTRIPVVGVAASTGGPQALSTMLAGLQGLAAAVLVVQHLHPDFMDGFLEWMGRDSALPVQMAEDGSGLQAGRVYVAPSNLHLKLGRGRTVILEPEPASLHRPSADVLFHSLAEHAGSAAIGVLLTGMGDDGAAGLLAIRDRGGRTIVQDEASSAVYGMPRAADRMGAAEQILALDQIAVAVLKAAQAVA